MSTNNMNRFEFRSIRLEETQQAIEIEQICFPPNEACSPKSLTERIKATAETFLVAEDKETGKLAAQNLLEQAYLYAFPLVIMDATRTASTNTPLLKQKATAKACNKNFLIYSSLLIDTKNLLLLFTEKYSELSIECAPGPTQPKMLAYTNLPRAAGGQKHRYR